MSSLVRWLESHQSPCSWKSMLGVECPGCGMQTALIDLLKGDLAASLKAFPALIPMILMILFLLLHLVFKFPKGAFILKFLFIFTSSIMMIGYMIRVFYH
jgi:hypothetical protein